jgi:hypothetical protein
VQIVQPATFGLLSERQKALALILVGRPTQQTQNGKALKISWPRLRRAENIFTLSFLLRSENQT